MSSSDWSKLNRLRRQLERALRLLERAETERDVAHERIARLEELLERYAVETEDQTISPSEASNEAGSAAG